MPSVTLTGVAATSGIGSVVQSTSPSAGDFQYYVPGRGYLNDATPTDFAVANWGYADGSASYVVVQVSPALSGVATTAAVGTIACQITSAVTGVASTGQIGTATVEVDHALTGVAATSAIGTLTPSLITVTPLGIQNPGGGRSIFIPLVPGVPVPALSNIILVVYDSGPSNSGMSILDDATPSSNTYVQYATTPLNGDPANGWLSIWVSWNCKTIPPTHTSGGIPVSNGILYNGGFDSVGIAASAFYTQHALQTVRPTARDAFGNSGTPSDNLNASPDNNSLIIGAIASLGLTPDSFVQDSAHALYATPPLISTTTTGFGKDVLVAGGTVISSDLLTYAPSILSRPWAEIMMTLAPQLMFGVEAVASTIDIWMPVQITTNPAIAGDVATSAVTAPSVQVEIGLTGVQANSAVGTLLLAAPLDGVVAVSHIGVLELDRPTTIAGVAANAGSGQLLTISGPNRTNISVSGVATPATVGTLTSNDLIAVSGVSGNAVVGTPTVAIYRSGLQLTDIECTAVVSMEDDFSMTLRWSDTDGYSWSDSAIRSIGMTGQYLTNPQWRRLGLSRRGRVFQVSWSCPQATALQGATVRFEDAST